MLRAIKKHEYQVQTHSHTQALVLRLRMLIEDLCIFPRIFRLRHLENRQKTYFTGSIALEIACF